MKCQINYQISKKPRKQINIKSILISVQHVENFDRCTFVAYIRNNIILKTLQHFGFEITEKKLPVIIINPSNNFTVGG